MSNVFQSANAREMDQNGFRARVTPVLAEAGAMALGGSVWVIKPGAAGCPYHHHFGLEEVAIVLEGTLALRTPDGWSELAAGEVVVFPRGPAGAHQLANRSDADVRVLVLSDKNTADVVVYPDSNKVSASGVVEGADAGDRWRGIFSLDGEVDYFEGEQAPDLSS